MARTFADLQAEVFRLYATREYAKALEVIRLESPRFPDRAGDTSYWYIDLTAVLGKTEEALRAFKLAVDAGHWWTPDALRNDPDLKTLQGLPDFERLVAVCRERHAAAEASVRPVLRLLAPRSHGPHPVLIALHGGGDNATEFSTHWQAAVDGGWLVAVPESSQLRSPNGHAWYDRQRAINEVRTHYESISRNQVLDLNRVVLGGYSQGGALAIWMALTSVIPARGFIGIAPPAQDIKEIESLLKYGAARTVRGYFVVGDSDSVFEGTRQLHNLLRSHDVPVELEVRPRLTHEVPKDFAKSLRRALTFIGM
jgi:predicted esterase